MQRLKHGVLLFLLILLLLVAYALYDNHRILIVEEIIEIERLPDSFNGFTLLLISDLHEKRFGKVQSRLLEVISSIDYDLMVIAGDMLNHSSQDPLPFFELLEGIEKPYPIVFAKGNTDPEEYDFFTGEITEFGRELERRGVTLLNRPLPISREEKTLWITSFQMYSRIQHMLATASDYPDQSFRETYWKFIATFYEEVNEDEVKIAITHYPASDRLLDDLSFADHRLPDYDLILAGHYHGGQIRLPFLGAFYVPEAVDGWFPPQDIVSGLKEYRDYQQYISRGLGASKTMGFLNFRLFNPPEINALVLKKKIP